MVALVPSAWADITCYLCQRSWKKVIIIPSSASLSVLETLLKKYLMDSDDSFHIVRILQGLETINFDIELKR